MEINFSLHVEPYWIPLFLIYGTLIIAMYLLDTDTPTSRSMMLISGACMSIILLSELTQAIRLKEYFALLQYIWYHTICITAFVLSILPIVYYESKYNQIHEYEGDDDSTAHFHMDGFTTADPCVAQRNPHVGDNQF